MPHKDHEFGRRACYSMCAMMFIVVRMVGLDMCVDGCADVGVRAIVVAGDVVIDVVLDVAVSAGSLACDIGAVVAVDSDPVHLLLFVVVCCVHISKELLPGV